MPKTYITRPGDTFSSISRAETGSERNAQLIKQANPHASTPFLPGTQLTIPGGDSKKGFKPYGLDSKIDGISIAAYDSFTLSTALDGFSRAEFVIPNEIQTRAIAPMLKPISVDIGYNGIPAFSGIMDAPVPSATENKKILTISASGWPNLLSSPPPTSIFPAEFKNMKLDKISEYLLAPYSIEPFFYSDIGPKFTKVILKQGDNLVDFFAGLCKQRALVMRDDEFGSIIFDNGTIAGAPILSIDDDSRPDVSVKLNVDFSKWSSHVTGILKSKHGRSKKQIVWKNPFYTGIMKNHEFEISDSDEGELQTAVNSVSSRMFAEVFSVEIIVPSWTDKNGELIKVGKSVNLRSTTNYINNFYEFLIDSVTISGAENTQVAIIGCTLPGSYSGTIPESVPWT